MAEYTLELQAGQEIDLAASGRYYRIMEASTALYVSPDGRDSVKRQQGVGAEVEGGFKSLKIMSPSAQTVLIEVTDGRVDDNRLSLSAPIKSDVGDTLTTFADVALAATATTQIVAANPARRELFITNLELNTQTLRIGDASTGAARGIELAPGSSLVLSTTAAVYGYNPGTSAESVAVMEVAD